MYYPNAISQFDYNFETIVWQDRRYKGIDEITMNGVCYLDFRGTIQNFGGVTAAHQLTNPFLKPDHLNRVKYRVTVHFRVRHTVPAGGTIQIFWANSVTAIYPHCRSMVSQGSDLYAQGGDNNGEIGCMIQPTNSWVITEFQNLPGGSQVKISGEVDYTGTAGSFIGVREIVTYNNTHETNIRDNGFIIDYMGASTGGLELDNY